MSPTIVCTYRIPKIEYHLLLLPILLLLILTLFYCRRCVSATTHARSCVHLSKYQHTYQMIGSANTILLSCRIIHARREPYTILWYWRAVYGYLARVVHNRKGGKIKENEKKMYTKGKKMKLDRSQQRHTASLTRYAFRSC